MKSLIVVLLTALVTPLSHGGPTENAILAGMKLSEQPNYTWKSIVVDDARTYEIQGKTIRGGYTWVRLPMVVEIARRLGPRAGDEIEAVFRGNERCVIRTQRGWQELQELPRENRFWTDADEWRFEHGSDSQRLVVAAAPPNRSDFGDPFARVRNAAPALNDGPDDVPRSNAQFGVSHPHEELGVIVGCLESASGDGETVTGTVTEIGAALLLVRDGQNDIQPLSAAGTFKLFIRNGIVVRYALQLEGILKMGDDRVHVRQYSNTVLSDFGTTAFVPPVEARAKLGGSDERQRADRGANAPRIAKSGN